MSHPTAIPLYERLFRSAAGIKVDKNDVRRLREFVDEQIDSVSIAGRDTAKWNGRDVIEPQDLPITRGVQELMREFDKLDEADEVRELLREAIRRPPADVTFSEDTEGTLLELFGGLSVGLARTFRVLEPTSENPTTKHWDKAFALFRLLF
jgi:Domain of unknown function (DUF1931)